MLGSDLRDPGESGIHICVGRVLAVAQRVHDPDLDTFKNPESFGIQPTDIARISDRSEPVSQGPYSAVDLPEREHRDAAALPRKFERYERLGDLVAGDDWRI